MSELLPPEITRTKIWKNTFAKQEGDIYKDRLIKAFIKFRDRAKILSNEISRDFPEFTVHDITHSDALWELADLIIGSDYILTPAEVFVLGGTFLLHDLGMALVAYPGGKKALYETHIWKATITYYLKEKLGRLPTKKEINNPVKEVEDKAIKDVLRDLHAERSEKLAFVEWNDGSSNPTRYHLIEDPEIRNTYGTIIGKVAHSHWWPVKYLEKEFQITLGAPSYLPNEWSVDPLKIACILRVADASHLDSSRAPGFLKALRKPSKYSKEHWTYQERLTKPRVESDRLSFTSVNSFSVDEFDSWWLCYDTLRMVDRELREVDALLADKNKQRFLVKSVSGIEDPSRLSRLIRTEGWIPVDARIKVSNVSLLVSTLGGEKLYGSDETIPLRELIQNSIDAIKARRILDNRPSDWGEITVRSGGDSRGYWVEVEDNGIGMSSEVLVGPFLDFGSSYWGSQLMREENSELVERGFQSIGKFGIGFFSVFMWGNKVQVFTRCYDEAPKDTRVLEFNGGLNSHPLLREAQSNEYIRDGGTRIRVWMKNKLKFNIWRLFDEKKMTLENICYYTAPSIEVNLYVQENCKGNPKKIISASDWISLDGEELFKRMSVFFRYKYDKDANFLNAIGENLKPLTNAKNQVVGRACIVKDHFKEEILGIVTVGGFYSCSVRGICGIFTGKSNTASRKSAEPIVGIQELHRWATEQSNLVTKLYSEDKDLVECAIFIRALGGSTGDLPIACLKGEWKNVDEIIKLAKAYDEIILIDRIYYEDLKKKYDKLKLHENIVFTNSYIPGILQPENFSSSNWPGSKIKANNLLWFHKQTLEGAIIEALAKAWSVSIADLFSESNFSDDDVRYEREIGVCNGKSVFHDVDVIRNPKNKKT